MTSGGFGYLGDELQGHVSHLGAISDRLDTSAGQARGAGAPPNAFGMIGSFIPALLQPMIDQATAVIAAGAASTSDSGRTMQNAVNAYRDTEATSASTLGNIRDVL